jgi:hypothetical protein
MEGNAQKDSKHISMYSLDELEALWSKAKQEINQQEQK